MNRLFVTIICLLAFTVTHAQGLYTKTFGNSKDMPLIFLHGGPGYNAASFEATTAQKLADNGFYVIVYDRRGEGRSSDKKATFTFQQTFDDLNEVYKNAGITKAALVGHSFGGVVATLYAKAYPGNVSSIILVGAPVSLQETFKTIIRTSKEIYLAKKDSVNLLYITMLENMNKASLEYGSYSFMHAMQNGFYSPKLPTDEAKQIYATFRTDTLLVKHAAKMTYEGPQGFWKNEKYTTIDLEKDIQYLAAGNIKLYALYGKEDGLYAATQVDLLSSIIGKNNLQYLDNCSHSVFIDRQSAFIDAIKTWVR